MSRAKQINPDAPFQPLRGASYLTGLSTNYIKQGCQNGTIPHIKVGADYRIDMVLWLKQLHAEAAEVSA